MLILLEATSQYTRFDPRCHAGPTRAVTAGLLKDACPLMLQGQADRCYAQEWSAEEQRTLELGLVKWPQVSNLLHSSWKQLA